MSLAHLHKMRRVEDADRDAVCCRGEDGEAYPFSELHTQCAAEFTHSPLAFSILSSLHAAPMPLLR